MKFLRSLIFLLLAVPAVVLAGNERMFRIAADQFQEGALLKKDSKIAIVHEGFKSISEIPQLPLHAHTFYLRHKKSSKEFYWYKGQVEDENFANLHAFSMQENLLKPEELVYTRFYGSRNSSAFQDETDIYFDKEFIYSSRVSTLYFMKDGRWKEIKETNRPGAIIIDTSVANLQFTSLTKRMSRPVSKIYPVKPGLYAFDFSAPDFLPYVDFVYVKNSEFVTFVPQMVPLDTESVVPVKTDVTGEAIDKAQSLEEVEGLYDKFHSDINLTLSMLDTSEFDKKYPKMKTSFDVFELNIPEDMPEYRQYVEQYNKRRAETKKIWQAYKLGVAGILETKLLYRLDSLQQKPLSGTMVPEKIEPIFENAPDSKNKRISAIRLTFGKEYGRFDVSWVGNASGVVPDTLYAILDAASSVTAHLTLEKNRPVWIYKDGTLTGRHHYRYIRLELIIDEETYACRGEFKLPSYIAEQPEVQEWVGKFVRPVAAPVAVATAKVVEPAAPDTVAADTAAIQDLGSATANSVAADRVSAVDSVAMDSSAAVGADSVSADTANLDSAKAAVADTIANDSASADSLVADTIAIDSASADSLVADSAALQTAADSVVADTVIADSSALQGADSAAVETAPADSSGSAGPVVAESVEKENVAPMDSSLGRIRKDAAYGTVALIDSGSFSYKGKVVSMSPFAIHTTEVTQQFYQEVMDRRNKIDRRKDRSVFVDPQKPVHNISWNDAREFCLAIGGDLPTEAQWEFAGRAGNNEGALWNLDEKPDPGVYAVYQENSYKQMKGAPDYGPQAVGSKKPNEWGLYDMSGNVAEWTKDKYFVFSLIVEPSNPTGAWMGSDKVYKGGSWKDQEKRLYLTSRENEDPRYWSNSIGFRCAFPRSTFEAK